MFAEGAATYIQELTTIDTTNSNLNDRDPLLILAMAILDLESIRISRIEETRLPLLSMLRRSRTKKSSDPRDKVFALLGLATEHIQASLKPNYNLSDNEVMLQTAIAVICENRGLEPLAGRVAGPEYLHSWVTNWHEMPAGNERERLDCLRFYDASDGQSGIAHLHGKAVLKLQGCFVGEIEHLGDVAPDSGFARLRGFVRRWERSWANIRAMNTSAGYTDDADEFWRTITADTLLGEDSNYGRATNSGPNAFWAWKNDDSGMRNRKTSYGPGGLVKNYVDPLTEFKNSFHYAVLTASGSRQFFVTKNGFIGIGPANLRRGDAIYVVLGSRVPLVMRQRPQSTRCFQNSVRDLFDYRGGVQTDTEVCNVLHDDIYGLVGDAYVHGIMDGAFVRDSRSSESIFVL
jgi:hypothetical protein